MHRFLWREETTWRELVILASVLVFIIALIGAAW